LGDEEAIEGIALLFAVQLDVRKAGKRRGSSSSHGRTAWVSARSLINWATGCLPAPQLDLLAGFDKGDELGKVGLGFAVREGVGHALTMALVSYLGQPGLTTKAPARNQSHQ
jgi:hypothetical protein